MNRTIRALALAAATLLWIAPLSHAGTKDTPELMMSVAPEGTQVTADALTASSEMSAFYKRLSSDKDYAAKLLGAIQKSDAAGIVSIMKQTMPRSDIAIQKINPDFHFDFTVHVGKSTYKGCASSDHSCEGHNIIWG